MNLRFEPGPKIENFKGVLMFYTRKEAADHAAGLGWPKNSARKAMLPFGRVRYVVSDPHGNVILEDCSNA